MKKTLYTVGPVEMFPDTLEQAGSSFRTSATRKFSALTLACEEAILADSRGSGGKPRSLLDLLGYGRDGGGDHQCPR